MAVANRELTRAINQFNIIITIRKTGLISRVEIAQITGQSQATVTNITAQLIKEKLIFEKETEESSTRGRRRILLALNPEAAYVVGVKFSPYRIGCAVTNMQADVKSSIMIPVYTSEKPAEFLADLITDAIKHCVAEARLDINRISGIGIGIPGFVDTKTGTCYWTPLYQKGDFSLKTLIEERLSIDTYIENDANTVTLAQQWFGQGKGVDSFLVVTIEDGVGMGLVINGQIHRGTKGMAGELGHIIVKPDGVSCRCGKKGCIEAYVSVLSIIEAANKAQAKGLWKHDNSGALQFNDIVAAAKEGEPALQDIFKEAGEVLGQGLASLVQIFNPQKIIITGEGVDAGDMMFESMRKAVRIATNSELFKLTNIVVQKWKDTDWARGAASLALQEIYKSPVNSIKPMI